jgi:hypothetical protein
VEPLDLEVHFQSVVLGGLAAQAVKVRGALRVRLGRGQRIFVAEPFQVPGGTLVASGAFCDVGVPVEVSAARLDVNMAVHGGVGGVSRRVGGDSSSRIRAALGATDAVRTPVEALGTLCRRVFGDGGSMVLCRACVVMRSLFVAVGATKVVRRRREKMRGAREHPCFGGRFAQTGSVREVVCSVLVASRCSQHASRDD